MTDQRPDLEHRKWVFEQNRRDAKCAHDKNAEFFLKVNEAAIATGTLAVRMSLLVTGDAAIFVLFIFGMVAVRNSILQLG